MPPTNPAPALKGAKKRTGNKKSAAAVQAAASRRDAAPAPAASQPAPSTTWAQVARKGKATVRKEEERGPSKTRRRRNRRSRNKLRAPKSAAVVLTLQPEAEKRGVSYKDILAKAKQSVDLAALEIPAVKYKLAVTGARMYEISGAACKEKADALAGKLREMLGEEDVRITRPQKCAELRITGLDDAASAAEIAAAISRPGGCKPEDVKVGEIRLDRRGCGMAWVKCPVEVATQITKPEVKVYVGWTVVRVTLLSARIMRCYRCHEVGHTKATCQSETDRGELCFRCGQSGHTARQCENPPHCALCATKGRPADHSVGSKACTKSAAKSRNGPRRSQALQKSATPSTATPSAGVVPMDAQ